MPVAIPARPCTPCTPTPAASGHAVVPVRRRFRRPERGTEHDPERGPERAYAVVLHDDAFNAIDHAARALAGVLDISPRQAWGLARRTHHRGRAVVFVGPATAARVIAARLKAVGPDPIMSAFGAGPLQVEVVTTDPNV